jgi:di/tricarboxylate transporter
LGIGTALSKTGAAEQVTIFLLQAGNHWSASGLIALLFAATLLLTSLISNAAAVAIVFPFAAAVATHATIPYKAVFLAIAFAASADFMTPIGYQTNLMVMGPGNYRFRDYFKTGFPLTLLYGGISLLFIFWYYNL